MALTRLWMYPPLAFGRVGNSPTPLECFYWGPDDLRPDGTGKTTIIPGETLEVAEDGTVSAYMPEHVRFKDDDGIRRVCPFLELWGAWDGEDGPEEGPITPHVLETFGRTLADVTWEVRASNLKPFYMTEDVANRIDAEVVIRGDDVEPKVLEGSSPADAAEPLVPVGRHVPLGSVRLTRPCDEFPELRMRFLPGGGAFYGPTDLKDRWNVDLPDDVLYLNPESSWAKWSPKPDDPRGTPGGQYAQDDDGVSFGMVDDVCDGVIVCTLQLGGDRQLTARARFASGPPDYAPDRRHPISIADGLKDRVDRVDVDPDLNPDYYQDMGLCAREVEELFRRIYETAALNNVDVLNDRVDIQENLMAAMSRGLTYQPTEHKAFKPPEKVAGRPLPLSDLARQHHRRLAPIEVLEDLLRRRPEIFDSWVRDPGNDSPFFDTKMPALMRGPHGDALHLTRRQHKFLGTWIRKLSEETSGDDSSGGDPA